MVPVRKCSFQDIYEAFVRGSQPGRNLSRNTNCSPIAQRQPHSFFRQASFSASLPVFRGLPGSLTVEAALAVPLFLSFLLAFLSLFSVIGFQLKLQGAMEEAAGEIVCAAGATGMNSSSDALIQTSLAAGRASAQMEGCCSLVSGGTDGLDFSASDVDEDTQVMYLTVDYELKIPALLFGSIGLPVRQRAVRRLWSGSEGTRWTLSFEEEEEETGENEEKTVYVTDQGSVYHLYADCTYLQPSVQKVSASDIQTYRSEDGSRYYPCTACSSAALGNYVYITSYGNRYHRSLGCTNLSHNVKAIPLSEAGSRGLCSKCGKRSGD